MRIPAALHQARVDEGVEERGGAGLRHVRGGRRLVESEGRVPVEECGKAEDLGDFEESGVGGKICGDLPGVGPVHASLPNRRGDFSESGAAKAP
ncbi:hypothetical protein GCM10023082_65110 [Streptomyces tremellae]|uniref:Uncharacterized protein n=1 Tax=Streptomyces tremellae TaxID=1124239 RepID=A0ABP7GGC2_9ACTN